MYVLVVGGLSSLLEAQGSLWIALFATALIAVLFQPLRERLQAGVDRLMYGERRDPYRVISDLGQRLEAALDPDTVLPVIVETVANALKLPYVAILLRQEAGRELPFAYGEPPSPTLPLVELPLIYQGVEVGTLKVSPRQGETDLAPADRRLLSDLARQAGMAAHAALATSALRQARERLVSAREEERRRLRRDLHDGLGPRLASQTLTLDVIARRLHANPQEAEALLNVLRSQTQQSVAEIRELINDLRPPALDDLGLAVALQELVGELAQTLATPEIFVQTPETFDDLPAAVEMAAYCIAQEALTNVVKHAEASKCQLTLWIEKLPASSMRPTGEKPTIVLFLEVQDNGRGITQDNANGVGLISMRERAAEVGGRLTIESAANRGTRLRAELPVIRGGTV